MQSVQVREAKARFSALVEAAERGEAITITRHGRPAAVLVSVEDARRLYPDGRPSLADPQLAMPSRLPKGPHILRDTAPLRSIGL
jgi:prevent-host-death family protein